MERLAVIVVTWNSAAVIDACLDALARHPASVPTDIVVVDNASSDDTVARARDHGARVIVNASNLGLAAANNIGIEATTTDAILIANPDTEVHADALDALLGLLDRHPRAAFAVPRLLHPDGRLHTSAGDLPTLGAALAGRQRARRRAAQTGFWWDGWAHDEERRIGRGHEACYAVRRAAVDEVGPQNERYVLDWEGIDWTERMARRGWEIWFTPDAVVTHHGGTSSRQVPVRWVLRQHRGMYRYFADRSSPWLRPALGAAFGGRAVLKLAGLAVGATRYERSQRSTSSA